MSGSSAMVASEASISAAPVSPLLCYRCSTSGSAGTALAKESEAGGGRSGGGRRRAALGCWT